MASVGDRRLVFPGILATTAVAMVAEGVVNVNLLPYAVSLGIPAALLGIVFSAHRMARIVGAPWVGLAADRLGRRPPLLCGVFSAALGLLALAFATGFWSILAARLLYGIASVLLITAGTASVLDLATPRERGRMLGIHQAALYGIYPAGSAIGGVLVDTAGPRRVFLGCGVVVLLAALLALVLVVETRHLGGRDRRSPVLGSTATPSHGSGATIASVIRLFSGPVGGYALLQMLSGFAVWGVFESTFVLFMFGRFGPATHFLGLAA